MQVQGDAMVQNNLLMNGAAGFASHDHQTWNAVERNAHPSPTSAILGSGDPVWQALDDITGAPRVGSVEAGCFDAP